MNGVTIIEGCTLTWSELLFYNDCVTLSVYSFFIIGVILSFAFIGLVIFAFLIWRHEKRKDELEIKIRELVKEKCLR